MPLGVYAAWVNPFVVCRCAGDGGLRAETVGAADSAEAAFARGTGLGSGDSRRGDVAKMIGYPVGVWWRIKNRNV